MTSSALEGAGVVCGLQSEARVLPPGGGYRLAISGASAARAEAAARRLLEEGASRLLSFGVSGGLAPGAAIGDVIVAEAVTTQAGERWDADAAWTDELAAGGSDDKRVSRKLILGSDAIIGDTAQKQRLFEETGAFAVDMESHAVARVAAEARVPFAALRAIADPADRAIPAIAAKGVGEAGETRAWPVLKAAIGRPADLLRLMKVGADSTAALKALRAILS